MILIDTIAFIEFLNRTGSIYDLTIEQLIRGDADCAIVDIVLTELLQGIKNDREFKTVRDSLLTFPILSIVDIVLTELLQGIKNDREFKTVRDSLLTFPILSLKSSASYIQAADLYRTCRKKGLTIRSTVDLLIAQTAIENNASLLHNDRDFEAIAHVSSLKLYSV